MPTAWIPGSPLPLTPIPLPGWVRSLLRGVPMFGVVFGGLALLLLLRLIERPLFGLHRPWTPHITVWVCRTALRLFGLKLTQRGVPMTHAGAWVSNHTSWLDIFVLNATGPLYFVSKSEVAGWPGIGWLARATGTLFVERRRSAALDQQNDLKTRLKAGQRLWVFPEGTSTDGKRVLPFKTTLFAPFFDPNIGRDLHIQPVSVIYIAPPGQDPRFYGWWGEMSFAPYFLRVLAQAPQGKIDVVFHAPVDVAKLKNRKALAAALEAHVRDGVTQGLAQG